MKKGPVYYPEDILVEKFQSGDFNWLDYISHYSEEWCEEYEQYCAERNLEEENDENAATFVAWKNDMIESALADSSR